MRKRWIKSWCELLLEQSGMTDMQNRLREAVWNGGASERKRLLDMGVDPDFFISDKYHLLEFAMNRTSNKRLEILRLLLRAGLPHEIGIGREKRNIVYKAVINGNPDIVKLLIEEGADPNGNSSDERGNPLDTAIGLGRLEVAKVLLDEGADPNAHNAAIFTAIYSADPEALRLLLRYGANPDVESYDTTALALLKRQKSDAGLFRRVPSGPETAIEQAKSLIIAGAKLIPAFKDFDEMYDWFDGDLSWFPGGEEALRRKFKATEIRRKLF